MTNLSPKQFAILLKLLDERARSIETAMQGQADRIQDISDPQLKTTVGDMAGQAEVAREREEESAAVDREMNELREIAAARQRLEAGEAGICIDCDEPIAFKRLQAQPTATRCINCQALAEHPAQVGNGKGRESGTSEVDSRADGTRAAESRLKQAS